MLMTQITGFMTQFCTAIFSQGMSDLCFDPDTFVESLGENEVQKGENADKTRH